MKKLIVVGAYLDTDAKEVILFDCLSQLKKLGHSILLTINSSYVSERVLKLCTYCVYNNDNTLIPPEMSSIFWYANYSDNIEVYSNGTAGYAILKKLRLAMAVALSMEYDDFVFLEYDSVISDADLPQINKLFSLVQNKKGVFFRFTWDDGPLGEANPLGFGTMIFAGNVRHFSEMDLPNRFTSWMNNPKYRYGSYVLEYKFASFFPLQQITADVMENKQHPEVMVIQEKYNDNAFFPSSALDLSTQIKYIRLIQNADLPSRPLFLIVGHGYAVTIWVNGVCIFDDTVPKEQWKTVYFDIDDTPHLVEIREGNDTNSFTVTLATLNQYAAGIRRNLV